MNARSHTPAPSRPPVLTIRPTSPAIQRQCDACQDEDARQLARKAEPAGPSYSFGKVSPVPAAPALHAPSGTPSGTLEVSEPHDAGEREADTVADEVMRRLSPSPPPDQAPPALSSSSGLRVQRQVDPTAAPSAGSLLVDDDTPDLLPGQMRKSEFLAALRPPVCDAADRELAAVGRNTQGCPYLDQMFAHYASRDARHVERAIRKYAPETSSVRAAADYIPLVTARIAEGVSRWAATGTMPELPEGLTPAMLAGGGVLGAIGGAVSSALGAVGGAIGGLFFKAEAGAARTGVDAQAVAARLGHGRALDGPARARMEGAFGHSFEHVRIHDDPGAAHLSRDLGARAFTVGSHVAFAAGQYRPGTVVGDALLAHELAHVVQQSGAAGRADPQPDGAVEGDADRAAAGALAALHAPAHAPPERGPRLRGGLRLSRCPAAATKTSAPQGPAATKGPQGTTPGTQAPAASTVTHYEVSTAKLPALDPQVTLAQIKDQLGEAKTAKKITSWSTPGQKAGSTAERYLLYTILLLAKKERWGSEVDVIAEVAPGTQGAITVRIDADGNAVATLVQSTAPTVAETYTTLADARAGLIATYKLTAVRDEHGKTWTVDKLNKVAAAWSRLSAAEASALEGYELVLTDELTVDGESVKGRTFSEDKPDPSKPASKVLHTRRILFVDALFERDKTNFIGGKGNAAPASFELLLHEPAHAIELQKLGAARAVEAQKLVDDNKAMADANTVQHAANKAINTALHGSYLQKDLAAAQPVMTAMLAAQSKLEAAQNAGSSTAVTTALAAVKAAELATRDTAMAAVPAGNSALARLKAAVTAQDTYVKAIEKLITTHKAVEAATATSQSFMSGKNTKPVQAFVDFVTKEHIDPPTDYAKKHWPGEPGEFFAEAFSLWKSDPEFFGSYSPKLKKWFDDGNHLK